MLSGQLDATILLEEPPEIEVVDDLVYVTDRLGKLVIRRCLRKSTFLRSIAKAVAIARKLDATRRGEVVRLHAAKPAKG